jgi:hypothetical protein
VSLARIASQLRPALPLKVRAAIVVVSWLTLGQTYRSVVAESAVWAGITEVAMGLLLLVARTTIRDAVDAVSMRLRGRFAAAPISGLCIMGGLASVALGVMHAISSVQVPH